MINLPDTQEYFYTPPPQIDLALAKRLLGMTPPKQPTKRCAYSKLILVRTEDYFIWYSPPCRTWRCELCLPFMRWKWGTHLMETIIGHAGRLFMDSISSDDWPSSRRSITKPRKGEVGGLFARVCDLVVSTAPVGFGGKTVTDPESAARAISISLAGVHPVALPRKHHHPVSTSRVWALPKRRKTGCVVAATVSGNTPPEKIREAMTAAGITIHPKKGDSPWVVRFPSWVEIDRIEAAMTLLKAG